ncbi:nucleolar preribosomal assembly protein, putative [Plasmodium sp. gorilla clade G1]|nr:nucleolar preribosomal assembly protein, putative [Plasmodium sp. gorilla clade G1]
MNEELEVDENAYDMLFSPLTPWPCLSFDYILEHPKHDALSEEEKKRRKENIDSGILNYPLEVCCVAGTQANKRELNQIYVIKWSNLNKLKNVDDEEGSSDNSEDNDSSDFDVNIDEENDDTINGNINNGMEKKEENNVNNKLNNNNNNNSKHKKNDKLKEKLQKNEDTHTHKKSSVICKAIKHKYGSINRTKICKKINSLVATWCDDSNIYIYDISDEIKNLEVRPYNEQIEKKPLHVFEKHTTEGFSLDWNPVHAAQLLTGDNNGNIYLWLPNNSGKWNYELLNLKNMYTTNGNNNNNNNKYNQNKQQCSIEDIQWCKKGNGLGNVFAMCSCDKSISILDIRNKNANSTNKNIHIENAHTNDVNVIAWNENTEFLLASGGDDNIIKVWDIRNTNNAVAQLIFHKQPISSISWNFKDTYVLLASSLDNSISIWDLSVETESLEFTDSKYPDQLLFEHLNQKFITDAKFHPHYPGLVVSTSSENFNIFKPCNI